jgi:SAM-dependent methyltransferase
MIAYSTEPISEAVAGEVRIASFVSAQDAHFDAKTVESFGDEWTKFSHFDEAEIQKIGDEYFDCVPSGILNAETVALDLGCGSGRWTRYLAPRVKFVEAIDPSSAVFASQQLTQGLPNVRVTQAGVDAIPFPDGSFDFLMCLGVLHHVPNTAGAIGKAAAKLKPGGHFLLYLYYSLDNRGALYRLLFNASTLIRRVVSHMPRWLKHFTCDALAVLVYCPFVGLAWLVKTLGGKQAYLKMPLSYYVGKSIRVIFNDALDRFGTPLEQRFSRVEIEQMLKAAGCSNVDFSERTPYWHCLATKD